jgi:imidazolonepropionase-like amidohydrolase
VKAAAPISTARRHRTARRLRLPAAGAAVALAVLWPAAAASPAAEAPAAAPAHPPPLLLRDVAVIDGSGSPPQPHRDVLIAHGRIAWIRATGVGDAGGRAPGAGVQVLDLPGRTVIPGLIDMHAHLFVEERDAEGEPTPKWDRESTLHMLPTFLRFGVTTVRDPAAPTEAAVTLRDAVNGGRLAGPRIVTAGRALIARPFAPDLFVHVRDADGVRREIAWQHAAGVEWVKVYASMPPELVAVAITEAHARGLRVVGHLGATTWGRAAELGIDGVEHPASWSPEELPPAAREGLPGGLFGRVAWLRALDLDAAETRATIRRLVENRVAVDPTLMAMHTKLFGDDRRYTENPDNRHAPPTVAAAWPRTSFTRDWTAAEYAEARQQWPKLLAWVRRLHEAGVRLTVGTDTPTPWIVPGVSVHDEMALLASAGIPPLAVLRMATHEAAAALGREDELGLVREGFVADLVVLADDPSAAIEATRSIELVVQGGRVSRPGAS